MYTDDEIDSAVAAGAISDESAASLRAHVAHLRSSPIADDERFRLVTGFNDIFVAVASALLLAAVGLIAGAVAPWVGALLVAGTAWALAECFVRRRRMALPAILLLLAYVAGVGAATVLSLEPLLGRGVLAAVLFSCAVTTYMHWRRFRVPITVAAGAATVLCCFALLVVVSLRVTPQDALWLMLAVGVVLFSMGFAWDASDIERRTRRSDVAFWLHLFAAPFIVHPLFHALGLLDAHASVSILRTVGALVIYVAIALVSLYVDRRALMVSALGYVLYAFTSLLKQSGVVSLDFAVTAFVVGSALLALSAFWHDARTAVLKRMPLSLRRLVPACHSASQQKRIAPA